MEIKHCDDRADLQGCGIYFLFGKDDESGEDLAYIGEAENIFERLKQHDSTSGKDFWSECVIFISKDNRLNKAHIKHLERACYQLAVEAGRYKLENSTIPADASLTEAEAAEMEEFLYNVKLLMNSLGHKVLEPLVQVPSAEEAAHKTFEVRGARGANARGMQTADGFVVLKGSIAANSVTRSCPENIQKLRTKLQDQKIINEQFVFVEDRVFSSFSTAAAVVLGRSANGLTEWRPVGQ